MTRRRDRRWRLLALVVVVVIAGVLSRFASSSPDGLQSVASRLGFADAEARVRVPSPFSGYAGGWGIPAGAARVLGVLVVLALVVGLSSVLRRRNGRP